MKYPVRLFLGEEEVEFSTPPEILFNYSVTELTNPTIVKNSYSKTITIEGTPNNNRIFGHIYNLERIQDDTINGGMGTGYNPLIKTDFTLYYNSQIYESGYFKLDEVRRNNNNIEYDITLYGGLGDFFYNLSYRGDGNSMELSDLTFAYEQDPSAQEDGTLEFDISKEVVASAWTKAGIINNQHSKWGTINFAPCYNGIPSVLSADKVLINNSGITGFSPTVTTSRQYYSMGITNEELTEWESFDLRSYLQRPVVRVREVLKAIFDPINNGGYTVNLDPQFFPVDDDPESSNPYYDSTWMTLPLLTEMDTPATITSNLVISDITREDTALYNVWQGLATVTNARVNLGIKYQQNGPEQSRYTGNTLYLTHEYQGNGGFTLQQRFITNYDTEGMILLQLLGYDEAGQVCTESDLIKITSPRAASFYFKTTDDWVKKIFDAEGPKTNINKVTTVYGAFYKKNGEYVFGNSNGKETAINFTFNKEAELTAIKLKVVPIQRNRIKRTAGGGELIYSASRISTWSQSYEVSTVYEDYSVVIGRNEYWGDAIYVPKGATGTTVSYEGFYTGRHYTKKDLLSLGITPANFLLSFAKMFGLYFIKDSESKTVSILTRHSFYQRDNIVNINDLVDKGSDIKITPQSPQYQYYDFGIEQVPSEAAESYKKTYGNEYGTAIVNTGYEFEKEHKQLLDGNCFKAGITVWEKDKYFLKPTNGVPTYVNNNFSYWYYLSDNNTQQHVRDSRPMTGETLNREGYVNYDLIPKVQFHTDGNSASDGSCVLLYCNGAINRNVGYHLTDDIPQMYTMNDGQPCWIMTRYTKDRAGNTIALDVDSLPRFGRESYTRSKFVFNSLDMGMPQTTYIPDIYVTEYQSIYSRGWKTYIQDLYNVNTRVLKCRCLLRERPNPEWMRRFYWFDNSYWRLNSIKDWNISSFDTTEMEFIKVQDIANYDSLPFSEYPIVEWRLETTHVPAQGGVIRGTIFISDGSRFHVNSPVYVIYTNGVTETLEGEIVNPSTGFYSIETEVTVNIPANMHDLARRFIITLELYDAEIEVPVTIYQDEGFSGSTIQLDTTSFPKSGGTYSGVVYSTVDGWHFEYPSWATPSPLSGNSGATEFTLTVAPNYTNSNRYGQFVLAPGSRVALTQFWE